MGMKVLGGWDPQNCLTSCTRTARVCCSERRREVSASTADGMGFSVLVVFNTYLS